MPPCSAALEDAFTALHVAADTGAAEVAAALLAAGGAADARDAHGNTPLHVAAAAGDEALTAMLMRGVAPDPRVTPWEPAALIAAARAGTFAPAGAAAAAPAAAPRAPAQAAPPPAAEPPSAAAEPPPPPPTPEAAARAAAAKATGDTAFAAGDFRRAAAAYAAALTDDPGAAPLHANRSVALLQAGDVAGAVAAAERCCALRPDWPKGCYRLGAALHAAERFEEAAHALFRGVQLGGGDDMARAFKRAVEAGRRQHQERTAAAAAGEAQ